MSAQPDIADQSSFTARLPKSWTLTLWLAALLSLMTVAIVLWIPDIEGVRLAIRVTARTSLILFGLTFTAAALWRLWPSEGTKWLRRNRRYLGVSFATSHALHLAAIVAFARMDPAAFDIASDPRTRIVGIVAYVFIALMTLTSFDRTAALIGRRAWTVLHTTGAYYIWLVFLLSHLKRTPLSAAYWIGTSVVAGFLVLRIAAWLKARAVARA